MNCPCCNRELAPTISVCFSCGAMVEDTVREELADKITVGAKKAQLAPISEPKPRPWILPPPVLEPMPLPKPPVEVVEKKEIPKKKIVPRYIPPPVRSRPNTEVPLNSPQREIMSKNTNPTLIDFQNKNTQVPEWRLQVQNAVRMRNGSASVEPGQQIPLIASQAAPVPSSNVQNEAQSAAAVSESSDPRLLNALKRIEDSRKKYLAPQKARAQSASVMTGTFGRTAPYTADGYLESSSGADVRGYAETLPASPERSGSANFGRARKFDTNKLPANPLFDDDLTDSPLTESTHTADVREFKSRQPFSEQPDVADESDVVAYQETEVEAATDEVEEIDDCAPISVRFNAALFDLIIGCFTSMVLLSPFMLASGRFFSWEGAIAFLAISSIVMFIYLTTTIGFFGRTFGMRLFSLEIVDAEENDYPTLHQAAVSSCIYLVSLAFGGLGFLTVLVNPEKRALHDLVSGTIVLREYE